MKKYFVSIEFTEVSYDVYSPFCDSQVTRRSLIIETDDIEEGIIELKKSTYISHKVSGLIQVTNISRL